MPNARIEINYAEIGRLDRGEGEYEGVRKDLEDRLHRVAEAAGEGHVVDVNTTSKRVRGVVVTSTETAMLAQANQHNLSRALDAARD